MHNKGIKNIEHGLSHRMVKDPSVCSFFYSIIKIKKLARFLPPLFKKKGWGGREQKNRAIMKDTNYNIEFLNKHWIALTTISSGKYTYEKRI